MKRKNITMLPVSSELGYCWIDMCIENKDSVITALMYENYKVYSVNTYGDKCRTIDDICDINDHGRYSIFLY